MAKLGQQFRKSKRADAWAFSRDHQNRTDIRLNAATLLELLQAKFRPHDEELASFIKDWPSALPAPVQNHLVDRITKRRSRGKPNSITISEFNFRYRAVPYLYKATFAALQFQNKPDAGNAAWEMIEEALGVSPGTAKRWHSRSMRMKLEDRYGGEPTMI